MLKSSLKKCKPTKKKSHTVDSNTATKKYLPDLTTFRSKFSSEGKPLSQIVIEGRG